MTSVSNVHKGINKCLSASFGNLQNKRKSENPLKNVAANIKRYLNVMSFTFNKQ